MKNQNRSRVTAVALLCASALSVSACGSMLGEKDLASEIRQDGRELTHIADKLDKAKAMISKGDRLVDDGRKQVRKGEGKIADGRDLVRKGNELKRQAELEYAAVAPNR